ncbi:hypothetical protein CIB95_04115 [Lottiidibacillus patelloidae]|uniref:Uncharacterized protein n=1 Tax=Lottiidibacillus patelloidae TaxID=2670334 RepID=A0A263BV09_9BACI|nr:hypothetical protein [Lottiidibacillus patelloidae]OZM57564.1 hypothetical protein CIB95_04115 [Lottiidibacillus patelloidae]
MNNKIKVVSIAILSMLVIYSIWFTFPKQHTKTLQGISYQLGNEEALQEVTISIDGEVKRGLFAKKTFEGTLEIQGEELPVPIGERNITIKFNENGQGIIVYAGFSDGEPYTYYYGSIFANDDFTKVTILKGSWHAKDGNMITAPAKNYTEALNISNELMKNFLRNPLK